MYLTPPHPKTSAKEGKMHGRKGDKKPSGNTYLDLDDILLPKNYDRESLGNLNELSASIKNEGQLVPCLVRPSTTAGKFLLVDGRRRLAALKESGIQQALVAFTDAKDDLDAFKKSIVTNINRKELNPIELGNAFNVLIDNSMTSREVARACGVSEGFVSQHLSYLKLPEELKSALRDGTISKSQSRALLRLSAPEDKKMLIRLAKQAIKGTPAQEIADSVSVHLETKNKHKPKPSKKVGRPFHVKDYQSLLPKIQCVSHSDIVQLLTEVEARRQKTTSTTKQAYLQGKRDGMELVAGLRLR